MSYMSFTFFAFVAFVSIVYFCFPPKYRWTILLAASYIFYWVGSSKAIIYIISTTITTFYAGRFIGTITDKFQSEKNNLNEDELNARKLRDQKTKNRILVCVLLINFGILAVVKYTDSAIAIINIFNRYLGLGALPMTGFLLPLGISFYTFQSIGYIIDVYRGKYPADKSLARFALFVSFFPQIAQGPIGRHDDLARQLCEPHRPEYNRIKNGILLITYGLAKKLIIADRAVVFVNSVFDSPGTTYGSIIFIAAALAMFQVYCDFSGGIDISRGVAQILGINIAENFRRPYFARSMAEFWQRWHITLGAWMRDYLFYPMLLTKTFQNFSRRLRSRIGPKWGRIIPTAVASFILFLIIGLWHGAEVKRIIYGLWFSILITSGIVFEPVFQKIHRLLGTRTDCFSYKLFACVRTALLVAVSRYFTQSSGLTQIIDYFKFTFISFSPSRLLDGALFTFGLGKVDFHIILCGAAAMLVIGVLQERGLSIRESLAKQNIWFRWGAYCIILILLMIFPYVGEVRNFHYAQF